MQRVSWWGAPGVGVGATLSISEPQPMIARVRPRPQDPIVRRNIEFQVSVAPRPEDRQLPQVVAVGVNRPQLAVVAAGPDDAEEEHPGIVAGRRAHVALGQDSTRAVAGAGGDLARS